MAGCVVFFNNYTPRALGGETVFLREQLRPTSLSAPSMERLKSCLLHPFFDEICDIIAVGGNTMRKPLLLLARNMSTPTDKNGNMYMICSDLLSELFNIITLRGLADITVANSIDTSHPEDYLNNFLRIPLYAGAVIMACCIHPYSSTEEEEEIRLKSYLKEINVMDRRGYRSEIDFSAFFGSYHSPLHHVDIPANPGIAKSIHKAIDECIDKTTTHLQYGRYSRHPLDHHTRHALKSKCAWLADTPVDEVLPVEIDRFRFNKRTRLEGGVEMKQRWYTHGISPRTYYVSGPTAFNNGRFLQEFFNNLCDSLAVTNRYTRTQPWRHYVPHHLHALFYDLTSFTSTLALQHTFLLELASYCEGIDFERLDMVEGVVVDNLGTVLREYANKLNHFHDWYNVEHSIEGFHGPAGFLGVYGNIGSATFIHGAILLMLTLKEDNASCAGDDALIVTDDDDFVFAAVRRIGILATEKTFSTESDAVYLKRRIFVNNRRRLAQQFHTMLPSFVPWMNPREYGRYRIEMSKSGSEKRSMAISSLDAAFRSCAGKLDDSLDIARRFFERYYQLLGLDSRGHVPQFRIDARVSDGFYPGLDHLGRSDYVESTIEDLYPGFARVSVRGPSVFPTSTFRLVKGLRFKVYGFGTRQMTVLKRLGIIEPVKDAGNSTIVYKDEGLDAVLLEYQRKKDPSCDLKWTTYLVKEFVPAYWPNTNSLDVEGYLESSLDSLAVSCTNTICLSADRTLRPFTQDYTETDDNSSADESDDDR